MVMSFMKRSLSNKVSKVRSRKLHKKKKYLVDEEGWESQDLDTFVRVAAYDSDLFMKRESAGKLDGNSASSCPIEACRLGGRQTTAARTALVEVVDQGTAFGKTSTVGFDKQTDVKTFVQTPDRIREGSVLQCKVEGGATIFWSLHSAHAVGQVAFGQLIVAVGPPQAGSENPLVPVAPTGAVQMDCFSLISHEGRASASEDLLSQCNSGIVDLYDVMWPLLETRYGASDVYMLKRVWMYLKKNPPPNQWRGPKTAMRAAVDAGRIDLVRVLLKAGLSPDECDEKGATPLHMATFEGNAPLCIVLLEGKADTNSRDTRGQSPIFFAPISRICRQLCEHQADVNLLNKKGQSALHLAGRAGFKDVHQWLVKYVRRLESLAGYTSPSLVDLRDCHGKTSACYLECGITLSKRTLEQIETNCFSEEMPDCGATLMCPVCEVQCSSDSHYCRTCGGALSKEAQDSARQESVKAFARKTSSSLSRVPKGMDKRFMDLLRFLFDMTVADYNTGLISRADLVRIAKRSPQMRSVLQVDDSSVVSKIYDIWADMDPNGAGVVNWAGFKQYFLTKGRNHDFLSGLGDAPLPVSARKRQWIKEGVDKVPRSRDMLKKIAQQRHATKVLREIWALADTDRDGFLTKADIIRACVSSPKMRSLLEIDNNIASSINCVWAELVKDGSGHLSWGDFLERYSTPEHVEKVTSKELFLKKPKLPAVQLQTRQNSREEAKRKRLAILRQVWDVADEDGNGMLSKKEVIKGCSEDIRLQLMLNMDGHMIAREVNMLWKRIGAASNEEISWDVFLENFHSSKDDAICSQLNMQATQRAPEAKGKVFKQSIDPVLARSLEIINKIFRDCSSDGGKTITKEDVKEASGLNPQLRMLLDLSKEDLTKDAVEDAWYAIDIEENNVLTWGEFKGHFVDGHDISPRVAWAARLPERDLSRTKLKVENNIQRGRPARTPLSAQTKMLRKAFEEIDRNGDGKLTKNEILLGCSINPDLKKLMNVPGSTLKQRVQLVLEAMDTEGEGCVTWPQFLAHFEETIEQEDDFD